MRRTIFRPVPRGVVEFVFWFFLSGISWLGLWVLLSAVILQWTPVAITSGSMSPSIRSGDVVMVEPYDGSPIRPGTVAVFRMAGSGDHVTHRVVSTHSDGTYITRGDANAGPDSTPLHSEQIVGVGRLLVPLVALPLAWLHNGQWLQLGIYLSGLSMVIALGGRRLIYRACPGEGGTADVDLGHADSAPSWIPTAPVYLPSGRPPAERAPAERPFPTSTGPRLVPILDPTPPEPVGQEPSRTKPAPWTRRPPRTAERSRKWWPSVGLNGSAWLALTAIGLALLLPTWPSSAAAYTSATDSTGNQWEAATLAAPTDLQASATCALLSPRVDLSWTVATPPAQGYEVYRSTDGVNYSPIATVSGGETTAYRDTNVSTNTTYTYVVRTSYGTWLSPDSNQASATTPLLCL